MNQHYRVIVAYLNRLGAASPEDKLLLDLKEADTPSKMGKILAAFHQDHPEIILKGNEDWVDFIKNNDVYDSTTLNHIDNARGLILEEVVLQLLQDEDVQALRTLVRKMPSNLHKIIDNVIKTGPVALSDVVEIWGMLLNEGILNLSEIDEVELIFAILEPECPETLKHHLWDEIYRYFEDEGIFTTDQFLNYSTFRGVFTNEDAKRLVKLRLLEAKLNRKEEVENQFNLKDLQTSHTWGPDLETLLALKKIIAKKGPLSIEDVQGLPLKKGLAASLIKAISTRSKERKLTDQLVQQFIEQTKKTGHTWPLNYESFHLRNHQNFGYELGQNPIQAVISLSPPQSLNLSPSEQALLDQIIRINNSPAHPKGLGWARIYIDEDRKLWVIDEIQSDILHGDPSLAAFANDISKARLVLPGTDEERVKLVNSLQNKLKDIYHVLYSAVLEQARRNNVKHVYVWEPGAKQEFSGMNEAKAEKIYGKHPQEILFEPGHDYYGYEMHRREAKKIL